MKKVNNLLLLFSALFLQLTVTSCGDDDELGSDPRARFSTEVDAANFLRVSFINESVNAESYEWSFGDGNTSTQENPTHTYEAGGQYEVSLTATSASGESDVRRETIAVVDELAAQRALIGESGKTWKLIRDVSLGSFPFVVGPSDRSQIWWSFGGAQRLCERPCILDDTYTFRPDGKFVRDVGTDFWAEGGVWADDAVGCFDVSDPANWIGANGQDLSAWGSGEFDYVYNVDANTIRLSGTGAYMGLSKVGTTAEFTSPQSSVTYQVAKLVEGEVDTLVLETTLTEAGGYWAFTFVSYGNPSLEPAIPSCDPVETSDVTFRVNMNNYEGDAQTPEINGTWNNFCGNCNPMTDEDGDGIWEATLTIATGSHEFKFSADNWADQEELTPGDPCTATNPEGFTNRVLEVGASDMVLDIVCWGSCSDCE